MWRRWRKGIGFTCTILYLYHPPIMDHGGCQGHCQHHKLLGIRSSAARQLGADGWDVAVPRGAMEEPVPKLRRVPTTKMMKERCTTETLSDLIPSYSYLIILFNFKMWFSLIFMISMISCWLGGLESWMKRIIDYHYAVSPQFDTASQVQLFVDFDIWIGFWDHPAVEFDGMLMLKGCWFEVESDGVLSETVEGQE